MKKVRILIGVIFIIALTGCLWMACESGGGDEGGGTDGKEPGFDGGKPAAPASTFVPVTDIFYVGGPMTYKVHDGTSGTNGTKDLKKSAVAFPDNATNDAVVWALPSGTPDYITLNSANILEVAVGNDPAFTDTVPKKVKVTASVLNGKASGQSYSKEIEIDLIKTDDWVAVTNILLLPATRKIEVDKNGKADPFVPAMTILPTNASALKNASKDNVIQWSIPPAAPAGITINPRTGVLTATEYLVIDKANGDTVTIKATIADGRAIGSDFDQTFDIIVKPAPKVPLTQIDKTGWEFKVDKNGSQGTAFNLTSKLFTKFIPLNASYTTAATVLWGTPSSGMSGIDWDGTSLTASTYALDKVIEGDTKTLTVKITETGMAEWNDTIPVKVIAANYYQIESITLAGGLEGTMTTTSGTPGRANIITDLSTSVTYLPLNAGSKAIKLWKNSNGTDKLTDLINITTAGDIEVPAAYDDAGKDFKVIAVVTNGKSKTEDKEIEVSVRIGTAP